MELHSVGDDDRATRHEAGSQGEQNREELPVVSDSRPATRYGEEQADGQTESGEATEQEGRSDTEPVSDSHKDTLPRAGDAGSAGG